MCVACVRQEPPRRQPGPDVYLAPDSTVRRGVIPPNGTLESVLLTHGVNAEGVQAIIQAARQVFDPRRLRSLQPFSLEQSLDGALRLFEYEIDVASSLRVAPASGADGPFRAEVVQVPATVSHEAVAGGIAEETPSLFQSIDAAGESPELAVALAQIFAGEIDFNSELQQGDRYTVAFERLEREGRPSSYGAITAAEFENDGRRLRAIRFTPTGGEAGYYDEEGRSLRRFFLRSPLKFEPRITSGFSARRFHPVLQTARAHRGVDYGAPVGAEVVSVAAGRVLSATFDSTNGRMVRIRHGSGYVSQYLHLSSFAAGIRAGVLVAQGQTIGRVGATGLVTGPHLHYGLEKNGVFVNPLQEHRNMPPGEPVRDGDRAAFAIERARALAALAAAARPALAAAVLPAQSPQ
jgi:murein DD-endopeptidase MepM/ murein hydrolase activator NlpD